MNTSGVELREHAAVSQILHSFTSYVWEVGLSSQNRRYSRLNPRPPSSYPWGIAQRECHGGLMSQKSDNVRHSSTCSTLSMQYFPKDFGDEIEVNHVLAE